MIVPIKISNTNANKTNELSEINGYSIINSYFKLIYYSFDLSFIVYEPKITNINYAILKIYCFHVSLLFSVLLYDAPIRKMI